MTKNLMVILIIVFFSSVTAAKKNRRAENKLGNHVELNNQSINQVSFLWCKSDKIFKTRFRDYKSCFQKTKQYVTRCSQSRCGANTRKRTVASVKTSSFSKCVRKCANYYLSKKASRR